MEALRLAAGGVDELRHPGAARVWLCGEHSLLVYPCVQALECISWVFHKITEVPR